MSEILTITGVVGALAAMGWMFYREVRKRANLEKELNTMKNVVAANKVLNYELTKADKELEKANLAISALEQTIVDRLDPADLADALNSVFHTNANSRDTD